jgi:hypothetical protein
MDRLGRIGLLVACALLWTGFSPTSSRAATAVRLLFYDRRGAAISADRARAIMQGAGWGNDALIDPTSLFDLESGPLYTDATGHLAFDLLGRPAALEVNWPTRRGYSMVILDNRGAGFTSGGTVNFTFQAALDSRRKLDLALGARPDYERSVAFQAAYDAAVADLDTASGSSDESVRGKYGQRALDRLAVANDLLLAEYGTAFAKTNVDTRPPWLGVTIDTTRRYRSNLRLARSVVGPFAYVRLVMDPGTAPAVYAPVVDFAHSLGIKIMGQPIDSSYAKRFPGAEYVHRIRRYVDALPTVDAWEIGNEVNGSWLGPHMGARLDRAAAYVKSAAPEAEVVLTLYWQIGTDAPRWSTFNWIRDNLRPTTVENTDVVLLSSWIEDAPLGLAFDQVMGRLHALFPAQRLGIGEMGYWGSGTSQAWWYGDPADIEHGRRIVADQYYRASLGYPWSVGGMFWWYFAEDFPSDPGLACVVSKVRRDIAGGEACGSPT